MHIKTQLRRLSLFLLISLVGTFATATVVSAARLYLPSISPTKTDAIIGDDGDGRADPGETIEYTVTIPNSGPDPATGVTFTDIIDANTTLVGGSLAVSPIGVNDTFPVEVIGNVSIDSASLSTPFSVASNDYLGLNPAATIVETNITTANGGQVVMTPSGANIGKFTYDPPAGFEGTDTFTYTLTDNLNVTSALANRQATVSITVSGMVWFINNNAGACSSSCDGRLSHPFTTLGAFNTANGLTGGLNPDNNENIFIYESATPYTGGVMLRAGQKLIGQDTTASLETITGLTPPTGSALFPMMNIAAPAAEIQNAGGDGLTLASNNTISGFNLGNSSGSAISGSNFGTLTVDTVSINTTGQALTLNTGTIAGTGFGSVTSNGGANNISLTGVAGTLPLGSGTLSGASGTAFNVSGGTLSATYSGNITQSNNAAMVSIAGGHATGTITFDTGTLNATNGTGLQFNDADGAYNFNSTTTLNGGDAGIDILSGSTGTFSFAAGTSINRANGVSGAAFNLLSSNANVTYSGSMTLGTTTGNLIAINNHDAGTITFETGALSKGSSTTQGLNVSDSNGGTINFLNPTISITTTSGNGISLTNNTGATINFATALSIATTSGTAFNATGGGTINVCDENPCNPAATGPLVNTLTSTTGAALNVNNTTIGANYLEFHSISSNGGTGNGIILDTTGSSGGLKVVGDGTDTSVGGNGSGGTIANKSGADGDNTQGIGIYLNNTSNIVLRRMTINGTNQNFGIRGFRVNNFTLEYSTVSGTNGTNAIIDNYGEGSIYFGDDASATTNGLTGSATITSINVSGGRARNFSVVNTAGTLNRLTITGSNFGLNQNFSDASDSLSVEARNAGTVLNATVTGSTFTGAPGDLAEFVGQTGTTMDVIFGGATGAPGTAPGNALSNSHAQNIIGGGGMTLATQGTMDFHVRGNTFRNANGSAVTFFKADTASALRGFFNNNIIGVSGIANSGSATGNGIFVSAGGTGTMSYTITNNQIHQINGNAHIYADNTGGSYTANFGIENNLLDTPGAGWFAGVAVTNGAPSSSDTINVCANIRNNTLNLGGGLGVIVGSSGNDGGHTFNLPGLPSSTEAAVESFIDGNNAGSFTTDAYADAPATFAAFTGAGAGCGTPVSLLPNSDHLLASAAQDSAKESNTAESSLPDISAHSYSVGTIATSSIYSPFDVGSFTAASRSAQDSEVEESVLGALTGSGGGKPLFTPIPSAPAFDPLDPDPIVIGTIPAGKSVTIKFRVTVDDPLPPGTTEITNQGTVSSNELPDVLTANGGTADCETGTETCTPVDRPSTTVSSIVRLASTPTKADSVSWTVTFADPVAGLAISNFTLVNGGLGGIPAITTLAPEGGTAPDDEWTVTASTGTGNGTLELSMTNDTGLSHQLTNQPYTEPLNGAVYTIDKTAPSTTSFTWQNPATTPTSADTLVFRVTFSEAVTGVNTTDFEVDGTTTATVTAVTPFSTSVYDVTVSGGNLAGFNGLVGLDFDTAAPANFITDLALNNLPKTEPPTKQEYTLDNTVPSATSFTRENPVTSPTDANVLVFRATFSDAVIGVDIGDFAVGGTTTATITNVATISAAVYDVTVSGGDLASFHGNVGLNFNAPSITDSAGNFLPNTEPTPDEVFTVGEAPTITSSDMASFRVGEAGSFTVTTTGYPIPAITRTGGLPAGLTFTDNGNGTGTLAGTPAVGTGSTSGYAGQFIASNGILPDNQQFFLFWIEEAPAITSANHVTFIAGSAGSFTVTTSGNPQSIITMTGALPTGVIFTDNNDGTVTLSGTPAAGSGGIYNLIFTADNGIPPNATQTFTLTVGEAPRITSVDMASFRVGQAGSFTVTTTGFPVPALTRTEALPAGLTFTDNGNGTGTLAGTPAVGTGRISGYPGHFTASNGILPDDSQSFMFWIEESPAITSSDNASFVVGQAGSFTVTTSGNPQSTLTMTGTLPTGVTFTDNNDGTVTLSGTPAAGTGGIYNLTFTADNGIPPNATQTFTLTVGETPAITSPNNVTFPVGVVGTFTVTTSGYPNSGILQGGATLPTGVSFVDNGDGTGTLSGTPAAGTSGVYNLTFTASNGMLPNATQIFTLTVGEAPSITGPNNVTFTVGAVGSFTVTTSGFPAPGILQGGATLPTGVSFVDNGDGTATLSGTPAAGTGGVYNLTFTASNGMLPTATQTFTLTVGEAPSITSPNNVTFVTGNPSSFTVTTTGNPVPASTSSGVLPSGVNFTDNGDGTAILSGTPALSSVGTYILLFTAHIDGVAPDATQAFVLTVDGPPGVDHINSDAPTSGGVIDENEHTTADILELLIVFNKGMESTDPIDVGDARNPLHYSLVQGTSTPIGIDSIAYNTVTRTTILGVNGGIALPDGKYTLTVKGDIKDTLGAPIGTDFVRTFFVDSVGPLLASVVTTQGNSPIIDGATVDVSFSSLKVTFNEDVDTGNVFADDATNPQNYLLVTPGPDGAFDTVSCDPGIALDDELIPTGPVTYTNNGGSGPFVATVQLNGGTPLLNGSYKLFICGTTSIVDLAGNALDAGRDQTLTFNILVVVRQNPQTGFAPNVVTILPEQPAEKAYTDLGSLWIEIPTLKLKTSITGVPLNAEGWDVTWLNRQVGWLEGTAYPTREGNTVLTAHGYTADGNAGPFALLKDLKYGETIVIHLGGMKYTYAVRTSFVINPNNTYWLTRHEELDWITLITCQQYDEKTKSYRYRRLVRAVLIGVEEE